jgi:hypothetical protein
MNGNQSQIGLIRWNTIKEEPMALLPSSEDYWLTRPEVGERLRVPEKTLAQWASQKKGPKYRRFGSLGASTIQRWRRRMIHTPPTTTAPVDLGAPTPSGSRCNPSLTRDQENTIMARQKKITEAAELEPVELDPPPAALAEWEALTDLDVDIVHRGDASEVISTPRPIWSDPDEDYIDSSGSSPLYMSRPARVALRHERGRAADYGDTLQPARVVVRTFMGRMFDQALYGVELKLVTGIKGEEASEKPWRHTCMSLTVSEARELVDVLIAAIDLVGVK